MFETLRFVLRSWIQPDSESPHLTLMERRVKNLTTIEELDSCLAASMERPLLIFKHSTACPISAEAYRQVRAYVAQAGPDQPEVHLVKVIEDRPVSNRIAEQLQIAHKSPQLLLVKDGEVTWNASHDGITLKAIQEAVSKFLPTRT